MAFTGYLTSKNIKIGLILLVGTGFGLYFGYLVGAALIASAMSPVGAGFLAALLTAMIILALVGSLWALFGRPGKGKVELLPIPTHPEQCRSSSSYSHQSTNNNKPIREIGELRSIPKDPEELDYLAEDWMDVHGAQNDNEEGLDNDYEDYKQLYNL